MKSGNFAVLVGGSSRYLPLSLTLGVRATNAAYPPLTRESMTKAIVEQPETRPVYGELMLTVFKALGIEVANTALLDDVG